MQGQFNFILLSCLTLVFYTYLLPPHVNPNLTHNSMGGFSIYVFPHFKIKLLVLELQRTGQEEEEIELSLCYREFENMSCKVVIDDVCSKFLTIH